MDRLLRFNVLAMSGRAVEAAGDVDTLLLDKTGTITFGNRQAAEIIPVPGVSEREAAEAALLASLSDETAEGRSIVALVQEKYGVTAPETPAPDARFVPFSATTRLSGVDLGSRKLRKGAVDAVAKFASEAAGRAIEQPPAFRAAVERIARSGGTPLGLADGGRLLGVIHLKDVVKPEIKERFAELRRMGIKTVMITGDNPVTAAAIASEAGVADFIAEATPEDKLRYIRDEQAQGRLIAMCGDGTNDAPALAQADVGVAMQTGTQAAREAGNMVDLDSDPDQADRGGRDRQAAADDARLADDLLDRQRRGQVFRHHPGAVRGRPARARRSQRHGPRHAAERHPVGHHLQRADHRRADPAGAAGRDLPADRRAGAAAAQPARLRARRRHRAVHRHQADRPHRRRPCSSPEGGSHASASPPCSRDDRGLHAADRARLSAGRHRHRAGHVPAAANGSLIVKDGKVIGSDTHRPGFQERPLLPAAPVGDHRYRSQGLVQDRRCALQRRRRPRAPISGPSRRSCSIA